MKSKNHTCPASAKKAGNFPEFLTELPKGFQHQKKSFTFDNNLVFRLAFESTPTREARLENLFFVLTRFLQGIFMLQVFYKMNR